jgi:anhydro-N-acetylmuramic acid kinase
MKLLGLMSGTSLDGLDIAYCDISDTHFELLAAETYPYDSQWTQWLSTLEHASAYEYALVNVELGHYFGKLVNRFRKEHPGKVDAIASHGHTIFHQPNLGLTTQIGDGDAIAAETGLPVVFNFRNLDVALGGQGAPLVPIGDRLLFGQYDACLNLGGIANISYEVSDATASARNKGKNLPETPFREAYDICPCNMALNHLARMAGKNYDADGLLARKGNIRKEILNQMDALDYYRQPLPKTLGKEWFVANFLPLLYAEGVEVNDLLCTTVEHIARQVSNAIKGHGLTTMLVTGGGAKNKFLIARLQAQIPGCKITVPSDSIIDYKESIIFALLGYLRLNRRPNCLSSVTDARFDNCGGNIAGLLIKSK